MTNLRDYEFYTGRGETLSERGRTLPAVEEDYELGSPERYVAGKELSDAVNVALLLGQPLLVAGEPGTGKTQLAWSIAHELLHSTPLVFNTKTTSAARDLFYSYDALSHFRDANLKLHLRHVLDGRFEHVHSLEPGGLNNRLHLPDRL